MGKKQYKGNTLHRENLPKGIINILRGKVTKMTTTKKDNKGALEILKNIYSRKEKLIRKQKGHVEKISQKKSEKMVMENWDIRSKLKSSFQIIKVPE